MPTSSQASIDDPPGDPESDKGYRAPSSPSNSWSSGETQVPGQDGFKDGSHDDAAIFSSFSSQQPRRQHSHSSMEKLMPNLKIGSKTSQ